MFARLFRRNAKPKPAQDTHLSAHDNEVFRKILRATGETEITLCVTDEAMNRIVDEFNHKCLPMHVLDYTATDLVTITDWGRVTFVRKSLSASAITPEQLADLNQRIEDRAATRSSGRIEEARA